MKKEITKEKVIFTLDPKLIDFLMNFENKSKYVEYLIYKYMKENNLIEKDLFIKSIEINDNR
jgi:hypothetical protein